MQSFRIFSTRRQALGLGLGLASQLAGCGPAGAARGAPYVRLAELANISPADADPVLEDPLPVSVGADPFAPLRRALTGLPRRDGRASILQLGDSHTAAPFLVGRLRTLFQDRFGAVGPGRLAPGSAPRSYRPGLVQLEQSGPWQSTSALRSSNPGPFGVACYRLRAAEPGAVIRLRSTESQGFQRLMVDLWMQPGGGRMRIGVDGSWSPYFRTAGPR